MKKAAFFVFILLLSTLLWAQNRYALIIGNANYPRAEDRLPNAINDTNDISTALRGLGFNVELKQNLQRIDMVREISAFITRLRSDRNSEGFFWYAGHAMEIEGENLLLPLDVNVENDDLIRATSFSVTNLTRQLGEVRNKVNVVVLDACRVPPSSGGSRSIGDTSRVIKTVTLTLPDLFVIFSTAPGTVAFDGAGRRNSPFAEAFLMNIRSTEPLLMMTGSVTSDTLSLTNQRQRPFTSGSMGRENSYYSLNPGVQPRPNPTPSPAPVPVPPSPSPSPQLPVPDAAKIHFDRGEEIRKNYRGWRHDGEMEREYFDHAIREYTEAIRLFPNYAEAYFGRGSIYHDFASRYFSAILDNVSYDRAIADYTEAIRLNPNYAEAYFKRGEAYRLCDNRNDDSVIDSANRDYDRAIAEYTEVIRRFPDAEAYFGRGYVYYYIKEDYDRAIADYTEAIRLDPNYAKAYSSRGDVYYYIKKDYDRAIADYTEVIRRFPDAGAYAMRGGAYLYKKDYDRAIADCTEAIRLNPNNARAYFNRGEAYRAKGDIVRADADRARANQLSGW